MSTPTASAAAQPSSASKKPTDHVSTPSRLNLASPAPRSIPSPAATRKDHSGKTPPNHPSASSFGSKTLGGTPMVQSLSQTGLTSSSSPGAHNAGFTPSALGLGVDLGTGTPGQMNMPTPLGGGVGMAVTMSELGLTASGSTKRNEDEDRRMKMRKVLKSIGKRKGRATREGLDRIARRVGFDTNLDPGEVLIAGKRTLVTIHHKDTVLQDVTAKVYLDDSFKELEEYQEPIGEVLKRDLRVPDGTLLHSSLDRFALNLDRLARMDRLSADVSCFAAVHGLYKCLERLHDLEYKAIRESRSEISEAKARNEAMRKRSGRAAIHGRGRVGLALDYWTAEELSTPTDSAMDVDGPDQTDDASEGAPDIFSLRIEAEGSAAAMYPSLRISDAWLPETFEIPAPDSGIDVPWQDPPPTYLPDAAANAQDSMAIDDGHRMPNLRFVAKLDPPIVMPFQTAMNILSAVGAQLPQVFGGLVQYQNLLLGASPEATSPGSLQADQTVFALRNGEEVQIPHHYALDVSKAEFGYKLEEFPFSHPKQLVQLLPTLRQWAHTGALLRNVFKSSSEATTLINGSNPTNGRTSDQMELDGLLDSTATTPNTLNVDIELSTSPQPSFSIVFAADSDATQVSNITLQVANNADIVVAQHDGLGDEGDEEVGKKFARALAICGDLSIWIEWLRRRRSGRD